MHLDEKLSLKDHIQNRSKKANYNLKLILNIWKYINIDTTKMLLSILVLSQLDYMNSILSRALTATIKPFQTIQNFAARVAYKKSKKRRCSHMPTRTALAALQVQNYIQTAYNSLQYSPWECSTIPQRKIKTKTIS